jgi:hypothetical protein
MIGTHHELYHHDAVDLTFWSPYESAKFSYGSVIRSAAYLTHTTLVLKSCQWVSYGRILYTEAVRYGAARSANTNANIKTA